MNKVELRLFGAFRSYSDAPLLPLEVPLPITVAELKPVIARHLAALRPDLGSAELVFDSAIASESEILSDEALIAGACTIAILPPVCGG